MFNTEGQCDELLQEKTLEYSSVQHLAAATPEKCKLKMNEMTVALKRIIQNWESSGQGDGGNNSLNAADAEESFAISKPHELGDLTHRNRRAIANRASFFRYSEMYLLYFWDVSEKYDLTRSCMQAFGEDIASGDGGVGVPSVFDDDSSVTSKGSSTSKKGGKKGVPESDDFAAIADSMKQFSQRSEQMQKFDGQQKTKDRDHATKERIRGEYHASRERLSAEVEALQRDKRNYEWQLILHNAKRQRLDDSDPTADAMQQFIANISEEVHSKKREIERLDNEMKLKDSTDATPRKNNCTPK